MEATTKMRSWMFVVSVIASGACGRVLSGDPDELGDEPSDAPRSVIQLESSTLKDERGDRIEYAPAGPVHEHEGAEIELGMGSCPAVYKYGYLVNGEPAFGRETTPNPLAWRFSIDMDPDANRRFRVRDEADRVVIDWTELPAPEAEGIYTVELAGGGSRPLTPAFAERSGKYFLDVWVQHGHDEAVKTWCIDYHVLRAPLHVAPTIHGEMATWSFSNDAPISHVITGTPATPLASQRITQYTAQSVDVTWTVPAPAVRYTKLAVTDVVAEVRNTVYSCGRGYTLKGVCSRNLATVVDPPEEASTGTSSAALGLLLIDELTGENVAESVAGALVWTIPGRASNESPHSYRLVVTLGGVRELGPQDGGEDYGEYAHLGLGYTGRAATMAGEECTNWSSTIEGDCMRWIRYWTVEALDRTRVEIDPLMLNMTVAGIWTKPYAPPHVEPSVLGLAATTWDAGDEDVPGTAH
jgi:hypothetical protein